MSYNQSYLGTKNVSYTDSDKSDFVNLPGIYIGIIKAFDIKSRSGRVWVYIPNLGGPDPDNQKNWRLVSYASPFMGRTTGAGSDYNTVTQQSNTFLRSTQSYGFYMSPPDVGSEVICCFIEGRLDGYWFACVNPSPTRHMIPAIGSVPVNQIDPFSIEEFGLQSLIRTDLSYPVAEANENWLGLYNSNGGFLPDIPKPLHVPQALNLIGQGLESDQIRGAISSSSQREPISSVFGFSTPGRPFGSQDPANDPDLQNKLQTGNFNPKDFQVTTRVGGHSLVMDDGDIYGKTNMVRLKTSAGHQLLMNDSEGLIYISNATGTAWIELTKQGDVLVYGARDLSIRTQGNLMMHSDKSISFFAARDFNVKTGSSIKLESNLIQNKANGALNFYGKQAQIKSQTSMGISAGGAMSIKSTSIMQLNGSKIALNGGSGGSSPSAEPASLKVYSLPDAKNQDLFWVAVPESLKSINYRVPTHEPYIRGSIQREIERQTAILESEASQNTDIEGNPISPETVNSTQGTDAAEVTLLTGSAPTDTFITQPAPLASLGNMDQTSVAALFAQNSYNASNGNYDYVSSNGELGKYGLKVDTLKSLGYVVDSTNQTLSSVRNENNWIGKDGITSYQDFINNREVQERAQYIYSRQVFAELQSAGLITQTTSTEESAGLLNAALNTSVGDVYQWYTTGFATNNSTIVESYNRGRFSQTQVSIIQSSNQSKV
jgi:hypothetical protein